MSQHYSDPKRASEPFALPDVEVWQAEVVELTTNCGVFEVAGDSEYARGFCPSCDKATCVHDLDDGGILHTHRQAYWYWHCFPGCLPNGDPQGPYATEDEAIAAAQEDSQDDDHEDDRMATCEDCGEEYLAWQADQHVCKADEPDEDSITTHDHEQFYQYNRLVLERLIDRQRVRFEDWYMYDSKGRQSKLGRFGDDHVAALKAYMDRVQFWPDVWFISDHGNAHRIDLG